MSDLINQLKGLGYSEEQIEAITNKKKIYFQNDVDNIVTKKETHLKEKMEKNFISKTDYDLLLSDYNNLSRDVKTNNVKQQFLQSGGKEEYFNDYLKINQHLLESGNNLQKDLSDTMNANKWAFNQTNTNIPQRFQDNQKDDKNFDGTTIYGKYYE